LSFLLNIFSSLLYYLISEPITASWPTLWMLCKVQYEPVIVDDLCDCCVVILMPWPTFWYMYNF